MQPAERGGRLTSAFRFNVTHPNHLMNYLIIKRRAAQNPGGNGRYAHATRPPNSVAETTEWGLGDRCRCQDALWLCFTREQPRALLP